MQFFVRAGLINDQGGKLTAALENKEDVPFLPTTASNYSFESEALVPGSIKNQIHESLDRFLIFMKGLGFDTNLNVQLRITNQLSSRVSFSPGGPTIEIPSSLAWDPDFPRIHISETILAGSKPGLLEVRPILPLRREKIDPGLELELQAFEH
jgi:hypothetical protein